MSTLLHVCLYNTEPGATKEIQSHITGLNFVRYVGEVSTAEELIRVLNTTEVNVVFFHLDPKPDAFIEVIDQVSTKFPNVALIGLSHKSDLNAVLGPMRAGCDQFVCEPIDPADLANAVARVASRRLSRSTKSRCICVAGPSGGSGATAIAINLALEIGHLTDRECGLLDLDLQFGDAAMYFDTEPRYTLFDLADAGDHMDRTLLASCVTALPCKVALVSRPELIEQAESITPDVVNRVVELMSTAYEHVVVDLPNKIDPSTLTVLQQADHVLIVAQLLVPSIRNARRYYDALVRHGLSEDRIDFVLNRVDTKSGRIAIADVEESVKKPIFATVPNDYQFVAKSIDFGRPIAAMDSNSQVRVALRKMANKLIVNSIHADSQNADRRGFLSRLLSAK
jgi:pilus assembly protein CpaE